MFFLTVDVLETMSTGNILRSFKPWRIDFEVGFAILCHVMVVFEFIWPVTFGIFGAIGLTSKSSVTPTPTVLALEYTWVHVGILNSGNVLSNIEEPINEQFSIGPALGILDIYPNCHYV